jgi:hypothetical protein
MMILNYRDRLVVHTDSLGPVESGWHPRSLSYGSTTEPGPVSSYYVSTIPTAPTGRTPQMQKLYPAVPESRLGE